MSGIALTSIPTLSGKDIGRCYGLLSSLPANYNPSHELDRTEQRCGARVRRLAIAYLLAIGTPEGMHRVKCPRCSHKQNGIALNPLWECRLCGQVSLTPPTPTERDKRIREQIRWGGLDD